MHSFRQKVVALAASGALGISVMLLSGCSVVSGLTGQAKSSSSASSSSSSSGSASAAKSTGIYAGELTPAAVLKENADYTVLKDSEWKKSDAVKVQLQGSGLAGSVQGVSAKNGVVTISKAGVYELSGSLKGSIVVAASAKSQVVLLLNGVTVTNTAGAAISVTGADDVGIYLASGSTNKITGAADSSSSGAKGAILADSDLTISGEGTLQVTATGEGADGIVSKDDLVLLAGNVRVSAADDGLRGHDALVLAGGKLRVSAKAGDGLKSDQEDDATKGYVLVRGGSAVIQAGDDGVQAQTDAILQGGTLKISAGDDGFKGEAIAVIGGGKLTVTNSAEGVEAAAVGFSGGTASITANDDGVNASGGTEGSAGSDSSGAAGQGGPGGGSMQDTGQRLEIRGGKLLVNAEGDGLDSNGSLTVKGGTTVVNGPTRGGNGAIDANGTITFAGGELFAFDSGDMAEGPASESSQSWVRVTGNIPAGAEVTVLDANGKTIGAATAAKQAAAVVVSVPDLQAGESYTVQVNGSTLATGTAGESYGSAGGMGGDPQGAQGGPQGGGAPGQRGQGGQPPQMPGSSN